eukprot:CAMPEP_0198333682 /NCGR_PEP_ID=MMETSP1450-20131203/19103_1 /TAXON_ID=753684 ORGANISM="Madagascaria erythrocladiodes, Strain CCMP3234" /NCGR_SAMPLE_ID=MMETSP1450 /ASSEMBLY_ACC=CAM_ASM_001115 /LENGTH=48 /DNA_ID= /DNA_START= /DNA_END= /DNA_ORIENTATION=
MASWEAPYGLMQHDRAWGQWTVTDGNRNFQMALSAQKRRVTDITMSSL